MKSRKIYRMRVQPAVPKSGTGTRGRDAGKRVRGRGTRGREMWDAGRDIGDVNKTY